MLYRKEEEEELHISILYFLGETVHLIWYTKIIFNFEVIRETASRRFCKSYCPSLSHDRISTSMLTNDIIIKIKRNKNAISLPILPDKSDVSPIINILDRKIT